MIVHRTFETVTINDVMHQHAVFNPVSIWPERSVLRQCKRKVQQTRSLLRSESKNVCFPLSDITCLPPCCFSGWCLPLLVVSHERSRLLHLLPINSISHEALPKDGIHPFKGLKPAARQVNSPRTEPSKTYSWLWPQILQKKKKKKNLTEEAQLIFTVNISTKNDQPSYHRVLAEGSRKAFLWFW